MKRLLKLIFLVILLLTFQAFSASADGISASAPILTDAIIGSTYFPPLFKNGTVVSKDMEHSSSDASRQSKLLSAHNRKWGLGLSKIKNRESS